MNIQERIEALETEFTEKIKALKAEVQREDEFPRDGDEYWYVDDDAEVMGTVWYGDDSDQGRLSIGNVFKIKEQAEFAVEKLKIEAELRKFSRPFEKGEYNSYIFFYIDGDYLEVGHKVSTPSQGAIYFESEEKAKQVIQSVGEERIKKYIFGVED